VLAARLYPALPPIFLSKRKAKCRGLDLPCKATRGHRFTCFALREILVLNTSSFILKATSCQTVRVQNQRILAGSERRSSILSDSGAFLGWSGVQLVGFRQDCVKRCSPEQLGADFVCSSGQRRFALHWAEHRRISIVFSGQFPSDRFANYRSESSGFFVV